MVLWEKLLPFSMVECMDWKSPHQVMAADVKPQLGNFSGRVSKDYRTTPEYEAKLAFYF